LKTKKKEKTEILRIVLKDLAYLHEEWDQNISENSLRVSSPVLRRLLVDDALLQRAWKAVNFEKSPRITAYSLKPDLQYMKEASHPVLLAWAGGARVAGLERIGNMILVPKYLSDEEAKVLSTAQGRQEEETLDLPKYIESPAIVVRGEVIPRRAVIKYIVNTQGGSHIGDKKVSEAEQRQYRRLDEAKNSGGAGYPVPFFELLSIGQALVRSEDIMKLREKLTGLRLGW
jgi:hypothetical protein